MSDATVIQRGVYRWYDQIFNRSVSGDDGRASIRIERFQQDDDSILPAPISVNIANGDAWGHVGMTADQARDLAAILCTAADTHERAQQGERVRSTGETVPST